MTTEKEKKPKKEKVSKPAKKSTKKVRKVKKVDFSMHGLMMKHGLPHDVRNQLGKEMANAYFAVTGTKPPKRIKDPKLKKNGQPAFQVSVYPMEWRPIAMNIIEQYIKKSGNGKV